MFKITHSDLCIVHNTYTNSLTTFQSTVLQVPDTELANSLAVGIGSLATKGEAAIKTPTGVDLNYGGTVSITTETETGHETHNVLTIT